MPVQEILREARVFLPGEEGRIHSILVPAPHAICNPNGTPQRLAHEECVLSSPAGLDLHADNNFQDPPFPCGILVICRQAGLSDETCLYRRGIGYLIGMAILRGDRQWLLRWQHVWVITTLEFTI